jgi:hypothetical protein
MVTRGNQLNGFDLVGLLNLAIILGVMFSPMLFFRRRRPGGPSDSDSGEGWRKRPPPSPPKPPAPPKGGIPLDDAQQARTRLRGHERLFDALPRRQRRPAREPQRIPQRTRQV